MRLIFNCIQWGKTLIDNRILFQRNLSFIYLLCNFDPLLLLHKQLILLFIWQLLLLNYSLLWTHLWIELRLWFIHLLPWLSIILYFCGTVNNRRTWAPAVGTGQKIFIKGRVLTFEILLIEIFIRVWFLFNHNRIF